MRAQKKSKSSKTSSHTGAAEETSSIPYPELVDGSSFVESAVKLTVTLAPIYSRDSMTGVYETLNSMLLHFVPQVRGVVLSYSKVKPLTDVALVFNDSPYGQLDIEANLLLWRPVSGMTLKGTINVQSPDHVGMLLWDTFNASIPASFIPKSKYEWRPFSDEEIAASTLQSKASTSSGSSDSDDSESEQPKTPTVPDITQSGSKYGSGEWVFKGTSQSVGANGDLEFMVVDVIRANDVLSVTGALL
ncbi:hypothetical protein GGI15_001914 [Coemansia interrupta]|uniref:RPA43 OB domain-containing protein n=1 Tax=Coemansia interrupta TaxID=1126814 RepID=A0A9W8HHW1_9FUNG|nr:hypothetical protein GGI15_001914 [Coemansia interrupta]